MKPQANPKDSEFIEKVIAIDRVARVVKGGRRFRFRAVVVIGDGKGRIGIGIGKASEVVPSITKASSRAKKSLALIVTKGNTIPHTNQVAFSGAKVLLMPASPGTGVIAGGAVRAVIEAAGIKDILTKSLGSNNKVNTAYATYVALNGLRSFPDRGDKKITKTVEPANTTEAQSEAAPETKAEKSKKAPAKAKAAKPKVKS